MRTINYIVKDPQGMHARPVGALVKEAKQYESSIVIKADGKEADAKRILSVMGLGVKQGYEIQVVIEGSDEELAENNIAEFLKKFL